MSYPYVLCLLQVKLSMVELTRAQWEVLGSEIALPGARIRCLDLEEVVNMVIIVIRCLDLEEVVNMVSESTFSFAKTICSVPEVLHPFFHLMIVAPVLNIPVAAPSPAPDPAAGEAERRAPGKRPLGDCGQEAEAEGEQAGQV